MNLNLLEKTEIWIGKLKLEEANLNEIAGVVAEVLELPRDKVLVVDVREDHITLDVLQHELKAEAVYGKKKELLNKLSFIPGVNIFEDTDIHSAGILGMIGLDEEDTSTVIKNTNKIAEEIQKRIAKRVIVYPTGFEVKRGMIEDTNTPLIMEMLKEKGYKVSSGDAIDDDVDLIAGKIRQAVNAGYGLVITTGGVGAEDKDKTVEAILKLDPNAATPYIAKFQKGTGRHEKDGVRIGIGRVGQTLIIALPGPNDEVKIGIEVIIRCLEIGVNKETLANELAKSLRDKLRKKHHKQHYKH